MDNAGCIHIYYGDGKGKTTAAFGLAFRCAGQGQQVLLAQFLKGNASGEAMAADRFPGICRLPGPDRIKFTFQMNKAERQAAAEAARDLLRRAIASTADIQPRLLVLDEVLDVYGGLLPAADLLDFLDSRPRELEVVLTGHALPSALARRADYITHMVKERHPFDRGLSARRGIEF